MSYERADSEDGRDGEAGIKWLPLNAYTLSVWQGGMGLLCTNMYL